MIRARLFLFVLAALLFLSAINPRASVEATEYPSIFENISTEQGLSHSSVYSITQDTYGYLWFGTRNGLNKYDGVEFTIYQNNAVDPASLSNNYVRIVYEDHNGVLWIGTNYGLNRFNRETETFSHYLNDPNDQSSLSNDVIRSSNCGLSVAHYWTKPMALPTIG